MTSNPSGGLDFPALPPQRLADGSMEGGGEFDVAGGPGGHAAAEPGRTPPPSSLADLRDELTQELATAEQAWPNPSRPRYSAQFRLDLTEPDFDQARKQATTKRGRNGRPDEVSEVQQLQILLARYCTGILRDGQLLLEDGTGGEPLTFRSREFMALYGASRAIDAVRGFYGTDGAIVQVGRAWTQATGWLDDPEEGLAAAKAPTQR